jgi:hypothetical protein
VGRGGRDRRTTTEGARDQIDKLAKKYLGNDMYPWHNPQKKRVKV